MLAGARIAEKNGEIKFLGRFKFLEQMKDIPIDARAAIIAAQVEQVRVERDARFGMHEPIITRF